MHTRSTWVVFVLGGILLQPRAAAFVIATTFQLPTKNYPGTAPIDCPSHQGWQGYACPNRYYQDPKTKAPEIHVANDIQADQHNMDVWPTAAGTVMFARKWKSCPNWGYVLVIEHTLPDNSKVSSIYGHLDPATVTVSEGDIISDVTKPIGKTGAYSCWQEHLHFGIYLGAYGKPIGTYAPWLHGYISNGRFPDNYTDPRAFVLGHHAGFTSLSFNGVHADGNKYTFINTIDGSYSYTITIDATDPHDVQLTYQIGCGGNVFACPAMDLPFELVGTGYTGPHDVSIAATVWSQVGGSISLSSPATLSLATAGDSANNFSGIAGPMLTGGGGTLRIAGNIHTSAMNWSLVYNSSIGCCSVVPTHIRVQPVSNGWRMSGYNAQRTGQVATIGPATLPTFQALISPASGTLSRILADSSLLIYDGNTLRAYTPSGAPRWSTAVGPVSDIAASRRGTIYTSTPQSISAWIGSTGQPAWPGIVNLGNATESSALAVDRNGSVYIVSGANVTAIDETGSIKWQNGGLTFRGYEQAVLNSDESLGYILGLVDSWTGPEAFEHGFSIITGSDVYGAASYQQIRGNTYAFAPWNVLYTGGYDTVLVGCAPNFSPCNSIGIPNASGGIITLTTTGLIVVPGTGGNYISATQSGTPVWTSSEPLTNGFSDAAGTLFAIASSTADIVAFNPATGQQLWRQHFSSTPSSLLLGDDGCLYANVGNSLYKGCR